MMNKMKGMALVVVIAAFAALSAPAAVFAAAFTACLLWGEIPADRLTGAHARFAALAALVAAVPQPDAGAAVMACVAGLLVLTLPLAAAWRA